MSEFDFDELDRAVSKVLTAPDDSVTAPAVPSPDSVASQSRPAPAPSMSPAPSETSAFSASSTPPTPSAPAVRRASGRFMDMVHPSSDMRSRPPVARQAASDPAAGYRSPVSSFGATQPTGVSSPIPSVAASQSAPLAPTPQVAPAASTLDALIAPAASDIPSPLESPFLPDAKVEKRPLGGLPVSDDELSLSDMPSLSSSIEESLVEVSSIESEADDSIQIDSSATINFSANLPAETEPLLEAADPAPAITAPEPEFQLSSPEPAELLDDSSASASLDNSAPVTDTPTQAVTAPAPTVMTPDNSAAGPASITQQYTEQPSTAAEPGAIYDTESYHQPISAPTKKHSGAWVILWIVLLIAAGAGAGAAFYVYILPML